MSEEAQTEEIPNSTRDLEIDDEKELMIEDLDLWSAINRHYMAYHYQLPRIALQR